MKRFFICVAILLMVLIICVSFFAVASYAQTGTTILYQQNDRSVLSDFYGSVGGWGSNVQFALVGGWFSTFTTPDMGGGINGLEDLYLTIYTDGGCLDISPSYRPNIGSVSLQVNVMFNNTTRTQMPDGGCRYKVDWVHGNGSIFREGEEYYISFGLIDFARQDTFTYRLLGSPVGSVSNGVLGGTSPSFYTRTDMMVLDTKVAVPAFALCLGEDCMIQEEQVPVLPDNTRIIETIPVLGVATPLATSTDFYLGAQFNVKDMEYQEGMRVYMRWRQLTGGGLRGNPVRTAWGEYEHNIVGAGFGQMQTTANIVNTGVYTMYVELTAPRFSIFGLHLGNRVIDSRIGNFVVGEATEQELKMADLAITSGLMPPEVVMPTDEAGTEFFGIGARINELREGFFQKFPINWVMGFIEDMRNLEQNRISTAGVPAVIMDFSNVQSVNRVAMGSGGMSFTLFGANTFDQVAQIPGINAMRTLLSWLFYLCGGAHPASGPVGALQQPGGLDREWFFHGLCGNCVDLVEPDRCHGCAADLYGGQPDRGIGGYWICGGG